MRNGATPGRRERAKSGVVEGEGMTRRCLKSQHHHCATQRDNHARRIIKRRIKGKMIGQTEGACTAWFCRTYLGKYWPGFRSGRWRGHCLRSVRQVLP
jgi:hypothetical protein